MAKHTTFRTGGPADLFLMPQNRIELKESIALLREYNVPYLVIGNGSNLLVGDGGIRGAVIQLYQRMQNISIEGTEMTLDCGALLSAAAAQAADASLEGLAFASGIPGTFGGAVVMNAGRLWRRNEGCTSFCRCTDSGFGSKNNPCGRTGLVLPPQYCA